MAGNKCNGHDRRIPLEYKNHDQSTEDGEDNEDEEESSGDVSLEQATENTVRFH